MTYRFKYRRKFHVFYRSVKVIGHSFNQDLDRIILLLPNGGLQEISRWRECDCKLGPDWVIAKQKDIEKKSGQSVPIDRDLNAN